MDNRSNAFALQASSPSCTDSSNEPDFLHVGSGIPTCDAPDECFLSACSSMCSAASTVTSALCSIEQSVSLSSSSETTFDFATQLTLMLNGQRDSRKRPCDSKRGWRRCADRNAHSEHRHLDSFGNTHQAAHYSGCISAPRPEQRETSGFHPALEEFSLGSGNPYATRDLSLAALDQ